MSRKDAYAFAASLAATLMVSIVVFQAGDGTFGAVPAACAAMWPQDWTSILHLLHTLDLRDAARTTIIDSLVV